MLLLIEQYSSSGHELLAHFLIPVLPAVTGRHASAPFAQHKAARGGRIQTRTLCQSVSNRLSGAVDGRHQSAEFWTLWNRAARQSAGQSTTTDSQFGASALSMKVRTPARKQLLDVDRDLRTDHDQPDQLGFPFSAPTPHAGTHRIHASKCRWAVREGTIHSRIEAIDRDHTMALKRYR